MGIMLMGVCERVPLGTTATSSISTSSAGTATISAALVGAASM